MRVIIWVPEKSLAEFNKLVNEVYNGQQTNEHREALSRIQIFHDSPEGHRYRRDVGTYVRVSMEIDKFLCVYGN